MSIIFYLQYAATYTIWIFVTLLAIRCLSISPTLDRFSLATLATSCWYISAQTHWVLTMTPAMPGWVEIVWSVFEGSVGIILCWALYRRCGCAGCR